MENIKINTCFLIIVTIQQKRIESVLNEYIHIYIINN